MGYRPGMIATHAHPAYLYGGGIMLSNAYEYFGLLNIWVPPPDTDELAEQGLRFWTRVKPDIPFMGFSTGRFFEVAAKLGIEPKEAGLEFKSMPGFGMGKGLPLMTAGAECYAYLGGACGKLPGAHVNEDWCVVQAVDPATGREVPDGEWGNLTVTTLGRDNGLIRYDLEEACALLREPCPCGELPGAHVHEDWCVAQAIDPETGREVPDGEWGNLTVTTFGRDNPLLRYDLEEAAAVMREECPCGETSIRGLWGGRFKDLLSSQGKRFQVSELESALRTVPDVTQPTLEYQVVKPKAEDAPLVIMVESGTAGDAD